MKGIYFFEVMKNNRTEKIGFTYPELIFNLIQDGGNKGISVRELNVKTQLPEKTIRKQIEKLGLMNRITKRNVPNPTKLPRYRYYSKRQWIDIL